MVSRTEGRGQRSGFPPPPCDGPLDDNPAIAQIKADVDANDIVLFMKGTPMFPQCGFSAALVQILSQLEVKFKGVDVLADDNLRQGIKEYTDWPTIPQIFIDGEFVGGCDIVHEMHRNGELETAVQAAFSEG